MMDHQGKFHRRSIRLKDYDYSQAGAYFVTICMRNKECVFGEVVNGEMQLNQYGRIVETEWNKTEHIRRNVKLDVFVVMPNHFHGVLLIMIMDDSPVGATRRVAQARASHRLGPLQLGVRKPIRWAQSLDNLNPS